MELYPAIDLRGGNAVRLHQGDYAQETVYDHDPVAVAEGFAEAGARWIHVVDLDAARTGQRWNLPVIAAMASALGERVDLQVGGGVRAEGDARALAAAGAARVVLGTAALRHPEVVALCAVHVPVAVALDHRAGELALHGWTERAGLRVDEVLDRYPQASAFVVTDIARDGTLVGPDLVGLRAVLAATDVPVVASGGIGDLDDLVALAALEVDGRKLEGAIAGKALYEGRFTVPEALAALV